MEGYTPFQPESFSDDDAESSKETKKKKKRSPESITETKAEAPVEKKEDVVKKSKSLISKWLGEEEAAETKSEDEVEANTAETEADSPETVDAELEQLTPEETAEAELFWTDARLEELYAAEGQDENPEDAAVRQASIAFHEGHRHDIIETVPAANHHPAEAIQRQVAEQAEQPVEIDEDMPVRLTTTEPRPIESRPSVGPATLALEADKYVPDYRTNPNARYILVGGLVGYFIGRRRGRIKTERQMKRVQDKLEQQIEEAQRQIIDKETEVQHLARENYRQKSVEATPQTAARQEAKPESKSVSPAAETARRVTSPEQAGELGDQQILALAERVKIGETNLRQIYEAKLVTESGLRRLINEHLAGNDVRRALAREFLAKELSYERDPQLRDALSGSATQEARDRADTPSSRADYEAQLSDRQVQSAERRRYQTTSQTKPKSSSVSGGLLIALTLLALGLAAFAVVLSLTR